MAVADTAECGGAGGARGHGEVRWCRLRLPVRPVRLVHLAGALAHPSWEARRLLDLADTW